MPFLVSEILVWGGGGRGGVSNSLPDAIKLSEKADAINR